MHKRAHGIEFGSGHNGASNSAVSRKEAMERPSAWARDEDLEEGKRLHDLKAVSLSIPNSEATARPDKMIGIPCA